MPPPSSHPGSGNTVISFLYWPFKQPTIMVSYVFFSGGVDMTQKGYRVDKCIYLGGHHGFPNICDSWIFFVIYRPFQEILRMWQNAHANSIRHAMVCDVFLFLKSDNFIKGIVCICIVFFKKLRTLFLYLAYYIQTCSNDHLYRMMTHLRWPILSPPKQIPIQSLQYETTTCLTQPAITFFASKKITV